MLHVTQKQQSVGVTRIAVKKYIEGTNKDTIIIIIMNFSSRLGHWFGALYIEINLNQINQRKLLGTEWRNNKLNPQMIPSLGIESGPYCWFSFTWSTAMFFNENKRKRLHNNRVEFPEDLFRGSNMAAVTSCENREASPLTTAPAQTPKQSLHLHG